MVWRMRLKHIKSVNEDTRLALKLSSMWRLKQVLPKKFAAGLQ